MQRYDEFLKVFTTIQLYLQLIHASTNRNDGTLYCIFLYLIKLLSQFGEELPQPRERKGYDPTETSMKFYLVGMDKCYAIISL